MTYSRNGRLIIVGGTGVIGSATASAVLANNCDVITTSRNPCSRNQLAFELLNDDIINIIPNLSKEDCLVLLAGYSKMSWIYNNPQLARALNVDATIRLVDQCRSTETPVFFMSTDQVFNGGGGNYKEYQETCPLIYGFL